LGRLDFRAPVCTKIYSINSSKGSWRAKGEGGWDHLLSLDEPSSRQVVREKPDKRKELTSHEHTILTNIGENGKEKRWQTAEEKSKNSNIRKCQETRIREKLKGNN